MTNATLANTDVLTIAADAGFYNGNQAYSKPSVRQAWCDAFKAGVSLDEALESFRTRVHRGIAETKPEDLDKIEAKFLSNGYQRSLYLGLAMSRGIDAGTASLAAKFVSWEDIKSALETTADEALDDAFEALILEGEAKADARSAARDAAAIDIVKQAPVFADVLVANVDTSLNSAERAELVKVQALLTTLLA